MNTTLRTTILAALAASLYLGATTSASAQPFLQRLEERIRERMQQNFPPPPQQPASEAAATSLEAGYVGMVADDANDRGRGVRILDLRPGGPAEKAGLKKQDLITAVAGVRVREMNDLAEVLEMFPAGDVVVFDVLRGNASQKVQVTLGRRPASTGQPAPQTARPTLAPTAPTPAPPVADGPHLAAPEGPTPAPAQATEVEMLRQRVKELEQQVADLEKALAEALEKP